MIFFENSDIKPSICISCYRTMIKAKELEIDTGRKMTVTKHDIGDNRFELVILDLEKENVSTKM
jgi:hypothetical protein